MAERTVYAFCDSNCKYETMTKEQILTAIMNAVNSGSCGNVDAGFVTTIKTVNGGYLRFFVGTQAEYDALENKANLFAIISNDSTKDGILSAINGIIDGTQTVGHARFADRATKADDAEHAKLSDRAAMDLYADKPIHEVYAHKGESQFYLGTDYVVYPSGTLITLQSTDIYWVGDIIPSRTYKMHFLDVEDRDYSWNPFYGMYATKTSQYFIDHDLFVCGTVNMVADSTAPYGYKFLYLVQAL